ncbi:MAG: hypothetical protein MZV63_26580, partial [Marinilabiliales bacterium]|nr:hypothetical protein [Marinilabiliales bacterium]
MYLLSHRLSIRNREIVCKPEPAPGKRHGGSAVGFWRYALYQGAIGAIFLLNSFAKDYPLVARQPILQFFIPVLSAFCNAGFSLFPDNLMKYYDNGIVCLTVSVLLVMGGLGFIVIFDVYTLRSRIQGKKSAFSFHSLLVLRTTLWLILGGTIVFMLFEWFNVLEPMSWKAKILVSLFQAVTPRTSGFNTVDFDQLTDMTLVVTIFLMFVGASPASTGGSVKTTTLTVLLADCSEIPRSGRYKSYGTPHFTGYHVAGRVDCHFRRAYRLVSTLFLLL